MRSELKWGLIGASSIAGEYLVPAIRASGGEPVAVASRSHGYAQAFAEKHVIPTVFDDYRSLLESNAIDAVYISSLNALHEEQTLAAAQASMHVLCEKPLALSVAGAERMVAACREAGIVLATNHHLRSHAAVLRMRAAIEDGAIGTPLAARYSHAVLLPPDLRTWRLRADDAGGAILDLTVHAADTLRFLLSSEGESVVALTSATGQPDGEAEIGVMGSIAFENGVIAQFHNAFNVPFASGDVEIHGTRGSLHGRGVLAQQPGGTILLRSDRGERPVEIGTQDGPYMKVVDDFSRAVSEGLAPAATGSDGVQSLAVALAVRESSTTGRRIDLAV